MACTQLELEKKARWFSGTGCVFAVDYIHKHIGLERMKNIDMMGAYIYRSEIPIPCLYICFGAGGSWMADLPITKQMSITRTVAESARMGTFMQQIDPENKYSIRSWYYHIDLSIVKQIRRPTDLEIAQLQLRYRDLKSTTPSYKKKKAVKLSKDDRIQRELRALDRRRYNDAGILPPEERASDSEHMQAVKGEPRKEVRIGKRKLDGYRSDTSEDEKHRWDWTPPVSPIIAVVEDDNCSISSLDAELGSDDIGLDSELDEDVTIHARSPPKKRSKIDKVCKNRLELALKAMQVRSRQRSPLQ